MYWNASYTYIHSINWKGEHNDMYGVTKNKNQKMNHKSQWDHINYLKTTDSLNENIIEKSV